MEIESCGICLFRAAMPSKTSRRDGRSNLALPSVHSDVRARGCDAAVIDRGADVTQSQRDAMHEGLAEAEIAVEFLAMRRRGRRYQGSRWAPPTLRPAGSLWSRSIICLRSAVPPWRARRLKDQLPAPAARSWRAAPSCPSPAPQPPVRRPSRIRRRHAPVVAGATR